MITKTLVSGHRKQRRETQKLQLEGSVHISGLWGSRTEEPPPPHCPPISLPRRGHTSTHKTVPRRMPTGIHASTQAGWGVGTRQSPGSSTGRKASRHVCSESTRAGARGATWCAGGNSGGCGARDSLEMPSVDAHPSPCQAMPNFLGPTCAIFPERHAQILAPPYDLRNQEEPRSTWPPKAL